MELQVLETVVLVVHVLAALAIIGLVLIQQGRGADMGSGFGAGASSTVFGAGGSGNFLTRLTTTLAIAFFVTSFGLAFFAKEHSVEARNLGIPDVVDELPVEIEESVDSMDMDSMNMNSMDTDSTGVDSSASEVPSEIPEGEG